MRKCIAVCCLFAHRWGVSLAIFKANLHLWHKWSHRPQQTFSVVFKCWYFSVEVQVRVLRTRLWRSLGEEGCAKLWQPTNLMKYLWLFHVVGSYISFKLVFACVNYIKNKTHKKPRWLCDDLWWSVDEYVLQLLICGRVCYARFFLYTFFFNERQKWWQN